MIAIFSYGQCTLRFRFNGKRTRLTHKSEIAHETAHDTARCVLCISFEILDVYFDATAESCVYYLAFILHDSIDLSFM